MADHINKDCPMTQDTFFNGRLKVKQDPNGYRFSIDAVILAGHVKSRPRDTIVDLGTGCGIIPLILAYRDPGVRVYGVEIQQALFEMARVNAEVNRVENRVTVLLRDMKALTRDDLGGPVNGVVCNPPFHRPNSGRLNPNPQRAVARHELKVTLDDVVATAARILQPSGWFLTIYPPDRVTDVIMCMRKAGIEPKTLRPVYSRRDTNAKLVLIEGLNGGRDGMKFASPLFIYRRDGSYSAEVERLLGHRPLP